MAARKSAPGKAQARTTRPQRGSSAAVEHRVHTPEAAGSTPAPASKKSPRGPAGKGRPPRSAGAGAGPAEVTPAADAGSTPAGGTSATKARTGHLGKSPDTTTLDPHVERFITEYLANGLNATAAYLRIKPHVTLLAARVEACRLLARPNVRARVDAERSRLAGVAEMDRDALVKQLATIVLADPAELTQMRRVRCPHCWTPEQQASAWAEPNPDCATCAGEGEFRPWFADTRTLSPAARALFLGVKVSDKGMQVLMESKDAAREKLAKILGAYEADNRQKADAMAALIGRINAAGSSLPVYRQPEDSDAG